MSLPSGKIGNIKITNDDQILHWWKLNSNYDEGLNDEDFYTFWHSICELFALIYAQTVKVTDVSGNVDLIKRFLTTFGIKFNQSTTDQDIQYLYMNWISEIRDRGTLKIVQGKNLLKGMCLNLISSETVPFSSYFGENIDIADVYNIEFDCEFPVGSTSNGIIWGSSDHHIVDFVDDGTNTTIYLFDTIQSVTVAKSNTHAYHLKIIRNSTICSVYVDSVLILNNVGIYGGDDILYSRDNFLTGVGDGSQRIANIKIFAANGVDYTFLLNKPSYFIYDKDAKIFGFIVHNRDLDVIFVNDDLFLNNTSYKLIDGELNRLIKRDSADECIFPLLGEMDLEWNLNNSSPASTQTYPIVNFNKFQNKNGDIVRLDNFPVYIGTIDEYGAEAFIVDNSFIPNRSVMKIQSLSVDKRGVGGSVLIYPFSSIYIPIEETLDYEISFRMHISSPNTALRTQFQVMCSVDGEYFVQPKSAKSAGDTETFFLRNTSDNSFLNFIGKPLWVRGILYNSTKAQGIDMTGMNFNFADGRNLIMPTGTKFIAVNILFSNASDQAPIYIWDIQVRPIILNTSKGTIEVKNVILPYLKNNGDYNDEDMVRIIQNSLSPYNSSIKTKIL
jgi:hypothetical protein